MYYHLCPCSAAQTHFSINTVTAQLHTHTLTSPGERIKWSVFTTDTDIWGMEEECVCRVGMVWHQNELCKSECAAQMNLSANLTLPTSPCRSHPLLPSFILNNGKTTCKTLCKRNKWWKKIKDSKLTERKFPCYKL